MAINKKAARGVDVQSIRLAKRVDITNLPPVSKYERLVSELAESGAVPTTGVLVDGVSDNLDEMRILTPAGREVLIRIMTLPASGRKIMVGTVHIEDIARLDHNSRCVYSDARIDELAADIAINGLERPVEVTFSKERGFILLDGETRIKSLEKNGTKEVDALIVPYQNFSDWLDFAVYSLRKNDLGNPTCDFDRAQALNKAINEKGYSREEAIERFGLPAHEVRVLLPLAGFEGETFLALTKTGRLFSRHMLEHLKRLFKIDDHICSVVVKKIEVESNLGKKITESLVKNFVDDAIKEIHGEIKQQKREGNSFSRAIVSNSSNKRLATISFKSDGRSHTVSIKSTMSEQALLSLIADFEEGIKNQGEVETSDS